MNTKESNTHKFKAMTCEELSKILAAFGEKAVYSGSWIVTGVRTRADGNVNLLCRDEGDVVFNDTRINKTIVAFPSRTDIEINQLANNSDND